MSHNNAKDLDQWLKIDAYDYIGESLHFVYSFPSDLMEDI